MFQQYLPMCSSFEEQRALAFERHEEMQARIEAIDKAIEYTHTVVLPKLHDDLSNNCTIICRKDDYRIRINFSKNNQFDHMIIIVMPNILSEFDDRSNNESSQEFKYNVRLSKIDMLDMIDTIDTSEETKQKQSNIEAQIFYTYVGLRETIYLLTK